MVFEIEFKGKKSFDTLEEVKAFKAIIGDKYKSCYKAIYPDCTFYIVEWEE